MIPHFHRHPLREIIRLDAFNIAVPKKIAVCMKIDGIQRNRFQQLHQPLLVVSFFSQDLSQLATFHEQKWTACCLHSFLSGYSAKYEIIKLNLWVEETSGALHHCSQEQGATCLGIPPVTGAS